MKTEQTNWQCGGRQVQMVATAELPDFLRPEGAGADLVQSALNLAPVRDWKSKSTRPIWEIAFENLEVPQTTVERKKDAPRTWAIHAGHQAQMPDYSPFVELPPRELPMTNILTLELVGTRAYPVLVRAYFGPRVPPLPWMSSAKTARGGWAACDTYWHNHAYLRSPFNEIRPGSVVAEAPDWWW